MGLGPSPNGTLSTSAGLACGTDPIDTAWRYLGVGTATALAKRHKAHDQPRQLLRADIIINCPDDQSLRKNPGPDNSIYHSLVQPHSLSMCYAPDK